MPIMAMEQQQKKVMDKLYRENLQLGNKINSLSDQNVFYRIQINNFNKLTSSINKDLYKLGINFQNKGIIEDSAKVGPLFVISNKIKLKNLQLKIGNSIRHTEKFKKNLQGSLPFITKEAELLERDISVMLAKYLQLSEENKLFHNIENGHTLTTIFKDFRSAQRLHNRQHSALTSADLENKMKDTVKKLQFARKDQKQKNKTLAQLIAGNEVLEEEVNRLKALYSESAELNQLRAEQAKQLEQLQEQQRRLIAGIAKKSKQLQEQYAINKECKQRINDKNYQESKEIKVLEEEVMKCREQVREFKQKYRKIRISGIGKGKENERKNIC